MSSQTNIPDLSEKIVLLLKSGRTEAKTETQLIHGLGIGKDLLSRIKGGTRILTDDRFVKLCELFNLEQKEWFSPPEDLANPINDEERETAQIIRDIRTSSNPTLFRPPCE